MGRIGAVLLLAVLAGGCWRPLALQDEYFGPSNDPVAQVHGEARLAIGRHRGLQTVGRACAVPHPAPGAARSPEPGASNAREALGRLCASRARRSVAAHGSASAAYRRWVRGEVRELPTAASTAAAGG